MRAIMTQHVHPRAQAGQLRLATYNIHKCRGMDGRTRVDRIADVLSSLDADVIALQEVVGGGPEEEGQAAALGALLGMGWVMDSVRLLRGRAYGNVVLSRLPIAQNHKCDLSCDKREPRACMRVDVDVHGQVLHVFNVHLGTAVIGTPQAGAAAGRVRRRPARFPDRRCCSATSTNGSRA